MNGFRMPESMTDVYDPCRPLHVCRCTVASARAAVHNDRVNVVQPAWPAGGPTALRMILGAQLRRLREARGITREDAGHAIRGSESKISRMELGRVSLKLRDVTDLLTLYDVVDDRERDRVLSLVQQANSPGWWQAYDDVLPTWFSSYLGLEAAAASIWIYETHLVPGLLQTREYARAVMATSQRGETDGDIERRVDLRMSRQHILQRSDGTQLRVVLDEAVLHRSIGGADVMRAQLAHLREMSTKTNVTLQVLPFSAGAHAAHVGAFTILGFPDPDLPDVVYLEHLTSALYLDKQYDVSHYTEAMNDLCAQAPPPDRTAEILGKLGAAVG